MKPVSVYLKKYGPLVAAAGLALVFLIPVLWMVLSSFTVDEYVIRKLTAVKDIVGIKLTGTNYADVFKRLPFLSILANTLLFILPVVVCGMVINSAAGYAFARLEFKGRDVLFLVVNFLIIIPFESLVLPLFLMIGVSWKLMNSVPGLFLPYLVKAFNIFFMRQFYLSLPKELEEAARMEGASWVRVFFTVALPLARPAILTCVLLDFTIHWSEYLWPLVMTNRIDAETVQLGLGHFYTLPPIQWGDIMAYSVLATLPMVLLFAFFQKHLVPAFLASGLKG